MFRSLCAVYKNMCVQASTLSASGHLSALAATSLTHTQRLDWGHTHNPSFRTTNEKYGQRLPLEQVCLLFINQQLHAIGSKSLTSP